MKISITSYIVTCIMLGVFICCCEAQGTIVTPPENTTVCRGANVTISCGYMNDTILPVYWIINEGQPILDTSLSSDMYQLNNLGGPLNYSLTLLGADNTTTFQCSVELVVANSTLGTVTVIALPMTAPSITVPTPLSSTSFNVSWTITDPDHNYTVTWTNLRTDMISSVTVPENTNSYMVTGLNGMDNYKVSVTASNSCGMMMSDPFTVYGEPDAPMNVRIPEMNITRGSFVIQWNEVMDVFTITYNVTWYNENGTIGMVTVNSPSYTVTGLTANTTYNVTVVAINTCCGAGPVSNVTMTMTNMRPTTLPPASPPTSMPGGGINLLPNGAIVAVVCVIAFAVTLIAA